MIPLLVAPLVVDLGAGPTTAVVAADWFIWAAFALEYTVRLALTDRRWRWVRRHWPDLLVIALPFLRPLRVARSARALRLLRLGRAAAVLAHASTETRRLLVRHRLHYVLLAAGVILLACTLLVLAVEDGSGGTIDSFGDALWWAATTVTTVGYGDTYPVTPAGRGVAVFLMVTGIAVFGFLTAALAAFLLERAPSEADPVLDRLDELIDRVDRLEQRLADDLHRPVLPGPGPAERPSTAIDPCSGTSVP